MDYQTSAECQNCGWSGALTIPEGIKVEEMICPQCKTRSLSPFREEKIEEPQKEEGKE